MLKDVSISVFYKIVEDHFEPLKAIMEEDSQNTMSMMSSMGRIFITSDETETELMIRVNCETLTIARIGFQNERRGYGTRVLNWLKEYAAHHGQSKILIECANSDEIVCFAQKHCFVKKGESFDWYLNL